MKLSLILAFIVFVISLAVSVVIVLQIIWQIPNEPSPQRMRFLGTSIVIMLAALFYIPVGEAMNRIVSQGRKSCSKDNLD